MLSGLFFASAFTAQRAIMAQLVYFALASYLAFDEGLNSVVYLAVGVAMSIAGFGVDTGLFTTFVYLVAVPAMPASYLGFAPGAAFGLGTLAVLLAIGSVFGGVLQIAKKWGPERVQLFGTRVGARSLFYGGIIFVIAGILFRTGLQDTIPLDFGNLIVLAFMIGVIVPVMIVTWREVRQEPREGELKVQPASHS